MQAETSNTQAARGPLSPPNSPLDDLFATLAAHPSETYPPFGLRLDELAQQICAVGEEQRHVLAVRLLDDLLSELSPAGRVQERLGRILCLRVRENEFEPALREKAERKYLSLVQAGELDVVRQLNYDFQQLCRPELFSSSALIAAFSAAIPRVLGDERKWASTLSLLGEHSPLAPDVVAALRGNEEVKEALKARYFVQAEKDADNDRNERLRETLERHGLNTFLKDPKTLEKLGERFERALKEEDLCGAFDLLAFLPRSESFGELVAAGLGAEAKKSPSDLLSTEALSLLTRFKVQAKLALLRRTGTGFPGLGKDELEVFCAFFIDEDALKNSLFYGAVRKGVISRIQHLPNIREIDGLVELVLPQARGEVFGDDDFKKQVKAAVCARKDLIREFERLMPKGGVLEVHFRRELSEQAGELLDQEGQLLRLFYRMCCPLMPEGESILPGLARADLNIWERYEGAPLRIEESSRVQAIAEWEKILQVTRELSADPAQQSLAYLLACCLGSIASDLRHRREDEPGAVDKDHDARVAICWEIQAATTADPSERAELLRLIQRQPQG